MQSDRTDVDILSSVLKALPEIDVKAAQVRVRRRIDATLSHRNDRYVWWKRPIALPLPAAAAIVVGIGILGYTTLSDAVRGSSAEVAEVESPAARSLDVEVHVDAGHTSDLLEWLNEQDVGNVTIQLPENAEFDLFGEPVLVRPDELMIEPVVPAESDGQ